jgi:superfamily II DNA/RNA helicase
VSIPLIASEPYHSLIAQAKNGTGKTGAFAIGSVLRIERDSPETQVLVIANTRELVNQIYEVFEKLLKGTGITVSNFNTEYKPS